MNRLLIYLFLNYAIFLYEFNLGIFADTDIVIAMQVVFEAWLDVKRLGLRVVVPTLTAYVYLTASKLKLNIKVPNKFIPIKNKKLH